MFWTIKGAIIWSDFIGNCMLSFYALEKRWSIYNGCDDYIIARILDEWAWRQCYQIKLSLHINSLADIDTSLLGLLLLLCYKCKLWNRQETHKSQKKTQPLDIQQMKRILMDTVGIPLKHHHKLTSWSEIKQLWLVVETPQTLRTEKPLAVTSAGGDTGKRPKKVDLWQGCWAR